MTVHTAFLPAPSWAVCCWQYTLKWLPGLDCTNTVRLNKPSCYFDTTWQLHWRSPKDSHLHYSV